MSTDNDGNPPRAAIPHQPKRTAAAARGIAGHPDRDHRGGREAEAGHRSRQRSRRQAEEEGQANRSATAPVEAEAVKRMEEVERDTITAAIAQCDGSYLRAAQELGIGKTTVYNKMRKWGMHQPQRGQNARAEQPPPAPPTPILLLIPTSREEQARANLRCPKCHRDLALPDRRTP
jgi:hypothetical protein